MEICLLSPFVDHMKIIKNGDRFPSLDYLQSHSPINTIIIVKCIRNKKTTYRIIDSRVSLTHIKNRYDCNYYSNVIFYYANKKIFSFS